jgi:AraC-like DNA-binding protein
MHPHLVFGWRTALLLVLSAQLLALAVALWRHALNRRPNRLLSAYLVVIVGIMTPYTIGFAGFYDAWQGLTFAPFAITLLIAPLLYGYAHVLVRGAPPRWWRWHLAPGLAQFGYMSAAFILPLDLKMRWSDGPHAHWISPAIDAAVLAGLIGYPVAAMRLLSGYRAALAEQRSDDDLFAARWLGLVLATMVATALAWTAWQARALVTGHFSYFEFFGLHLAFGVIGVILGVEGWRHAGLSFARVAAAPATPTALSAPGPDWSALAADYGRRTREEGWWRDPDLSLPGLARRLGANTGRLSRAINNGLGMNFSSFVNGLRAEGVAQALERGASEDLLDLALSMGFASKASFNRAFRERFGMSPSEYRRRVSDPAFSPTDPKLRRAAR